MYAADAGAAVVTSSPPPDIARSVWKGQKIQLQKMAGRKDDMPQAARSIRPFRGGAAASRRRPVKWSLLGTVRRTPQMAPKYVRHTCGGPSLPGQLSRWLYRGFLVGSHQPSRQKNGGSSKYGLQAARWISRQKEWSRRRRFAAAHCYLDVDAEDADDTPTSPPRYTIRGFGRPDRSGFPPAVSQRALRMSKTLIEAQRGVDYRAVVNRRDVEAGRLERALLFTAAPS